MQLEREQEPRGAERLPDAVAGFRIVRRLATGGTSDVLLAQAKGATGPRDVVLKLLLAQFKDDPSFERMFAMEAAAYARLQHPAIVKLYDFFASGDQLVMVLEYVDGMPLNALRAHLTNMGEVLEDRAVLFLMARVFSALAAAHAAKDPETGDHAPVIHRDVNPSNVLLHRDGAVKLADFGIAKVTGMSGDTKTGFIKGTFGYMSPEQVRGEQVSVRADVYAATLLLWELLARRRAIQHGALSDLEALRAMAHPTMVSLDVLRGDLPARLRQVIARGLEPQAENRNVTAEELSRALLDVVSEDEGQTRLAAAIAKVRAPDSEELLATSPSPSVAESMARLAEADEDPPPLPSYSVPAPPLSDMDDVAETKLNTDSHRGRALMQSVPDDVPTSPANEGAIASLADDSLELPRFPMPSISDAPPPVPRPTTLVPDTQPAEGSPPSSRRSQGPPSQRLAIPRPASTAPGGLEGPPSSKPRSLPRPVTDSMPSSKPPSSKPSVPRIATPGPMDAQRPRTLMGGFSTPAPPLPPAVGASTSPKPSAASSPPPLLATASSPPPLLATASSPPPLATAEVHPDAPVKTAPMAIVGSALHGASPAAAENPLTKTLAMPDAPRPLHFALAAPASAAPPPLVPASIPPAVNEERGKITEQASFLRNAMPTAPASFLLPASAPLASLTSTPPGRPKRTGLYAFAAAFAVTIVVVVAVLWVLDQKAPPPPSVASASSAASSAAPEAPPTMTTTIAATTPVTATTTATTMTTTTATATATTTAAAPSASTGTSTETPIAGLSPTKGAIVAGKAARQHRVYVDEKLVGEGPGDYVVGCGAHTVKVGSAGKSLEVEVPCNGHVDVP